MRNEPRASHPGGEKQVLRCARDDKMRSDPQDPARIAYTPIAFCIASAIASVCRRMASSDSASIITRASFSVPE